MNRTRSRGLSSVLVVAFSALILLSACGSRHSEQSFFRRIVSRDGMVVTVQVPEGEQESIGTYRVTSMSGGGPSQKFEIERDGVVVDAWLLDLNGDDLVELIVWTASAGSGSYGTVDLFKLKNEEFHRVSVGALSAEQRTGYMGHDVYHIAGGRLMRTFPVYLDSGVNARPRGGIRQFVYEATENRWRNIRSGEEGRRHTE